jgi:hypothetical protein
MHCLAICGKYPVCGCLGFHVVRTDLTAYCTADHDRSFSITTNQRSVSDFQGVAFFSTVRVSSADWLLLSNSLNMSEATGYLGKSQTPPNIQKSIMDAQPKDLITPEKHLPDDLLKRPWASPPTRIRYRGPYQDDGTYTVVCGLRTVLARFLIWFNLPFCWFVGSAIATRHIDHWLNAHFSGSDATVAVTFVVTYIVYTILAHTVAVFGAIGYELWWNPYARAPTLRGEVGREEEVAMVKQNRKIARQIVRTLLPFL